MNKLDTIWRLLVTSLAVWRLSRVLFGNGGGSQGVGDSSEDLGTYRFWAGRGGDFVCWISVWLSSQTALWVACGFSGVFLSWLGMAGISCLFTLIEGADESPTRTPASMESQSEHSLGLGCVDGMQAHHG